jgi:hypothetical protein
MKIKYGIDQRKKTKIDEGATLKSFPKQKAYYYLPGSFVYAYAIACTNIVLQHSEKAARIYREIVSAWELPGCQSMIGGFEDCLPTTLTWKAKALEAKENGELVPELPREWFDTYFKNASSDFHGESHDNDWKLLLNKIEALILVGFNRQSDIENKKWRVVPDTSYWLKSVIILRSLTEFCKLKLEDLNKYKSVSINNEIYDLNIIMTEKPTDGPGRNIYRVLTGNFKKYGFALKHDTNILKDAEQWYKCRVDPGNIEIYIEEMYINGGITLDRGRIENDIAICDEATGYPRKRRK